MTHAPSNRQHRSLRLLWGGGVAVVAVFSLLPPSSAPVELLTELPVSDKFLHFAAYAVLAFVPVVHERRRLSILLMGATLLLGTALEFGQLLVPGRAFEVADVIADAWGIASGLLTGALARTLLRV